jgi:hypothetical protein
MSDDKVREEQTAYPRWLYHPTKAPEGQLFQTAADDPVPMAGWVESPADFPDADTERPSHPIAGRPSVGGPEVTPPIALPDKPQPKRRE